jgi:hypothetical protein
MSAGPDEWLKAVYFSFAAASFARPSAFFASASGVL